MRLPLVSWFGWTTELEILTLRRHARGVIPEGGLPITEPFMFLQPNAPILRVAGDGDGTTVRFPTGTALTDAHIEALGRRLPALIATRRHTPLTLDLSGVAVISSSALGKLLSLDRAVRAAEGRLVLTDPTPTVRRLLRLTRLDTLLTVLAERTSA